MATPLLGWISPQLRTQAQQDAHNAAVAKIPRLSLAPVQLAKGDKIVLTKYWKHPDVIADIGFEFTGFRQLTGSCVGVSIGNWLATLGAIQRVISDTPTKAFVPFWPFCYGRTRFNEGDRGQGEGAIDSVAGDQVATEGYFDWTQQGLPTPSRNDGIAISSSLELQYSDGNSQLVTKWLTLAKQHTGAKAICRSSDDIKNAVVNGYPVIDGCDNYVGNGSVVDSGDNAYVKGHYDGRGGHSTCILGYWEHPTDGPLFLYSNQWDGSTYPTDPAGGGRCTVWIPLSEMDKLFRTGGDQGETMALSHVSWFPAQPKIFDWKDVV